MALFVEKGPVGIEAWIKDRSMPENQRNLTVSDMQRHVTERFGFKVGVGIAA